MAIWPKFMKQKTIAVIGGGSAGLTAARTAHEMGAKVLFFMGDNADRASLCINAGCMPSKAMFEPIDAMHHARRHGWLHVDPRRPDEFLAEIVRWKDREIAEFRSYRQAEIQGLADDRFEIIRANAFFVNAHELESRGNRYRCDAAIIASGSVARIPKIEGLDSWNGVWTNDEILSNTRIPKSLAVVGAGAVGLEFSLRYARLGSEVTLISHSRVLPRYPAKFGERLAFIYERERVRVLTSRKIVRVARNSVGSYEIGIESREGDQQIMSEKVLIATGRRPAVDDLRVEAAGISLSEKGLLEIEDDMRVRGQQYIFAAGDVAGKRMVVHHAHIEGGIAAENAVSDGNRKWTKRSNIQVVFSDPEFAFAGMRPTEAENAGHKLVSASAESRDVGKLHLAGDDFGFGEFCADAKNARLLSAGLLCDDASNLIHLPAYAIDHEHTIHQLEDAEYYHPTKIEIISEIGDALCRKLGGHPFARAEE
jgi:pyruvate/2-oxoglutarate dehydrogenase complex dihydrolipoamide dehydrogenase (E3) component